MTHDKHLGLKEHILSCGDLAGEYGSIILLEDDLMVSSYFYTYACLALDFYKNAPEIAGVSLYNYEVAESCFYPFKAIDDGSDVYFIQIASSWGQMWTHSQWKSFRQWFALHPNMEEDPIIPNYLHNWGKHSWKKHFIHYLIRTNRYFVFPRLSLSTNFEEPGTNASTQGLFQVPLQTSPCNYNFQNFDKSKSVYDAWFEILPSCLNDFNQALGQYNYSVDLYGSKEIGSIQTSHILSSKKADRPVLLFGISLFPFETNVALNLPGNKIGLYEISNNTFHSENLEVTNYLEELNEKRRFGVSVVIPVELFIENDFKKTLDSIANQKYGQKECVIVSTKANHRSIRAAIPLPHYCRIVEAGSDLSFYSYLALGIDHCSNAIVTWVASGTTFEEGIFPKIGRLFETHQGVTWVRGINESCKTPEECASIDVAPYRLIPQLAFDLLLKNQLNSSLEMDFMVKHHLKELISGKISSPSLFLELISRHKLTIAGLRFGNKIRNSDTETERQKEEQKKELRGKYRHFVRNSLFKSILLKIAHKRRFYSRFYFSSYIFFHFDFPDVLRYDPKYDCFYWSKT